MPSQPQSPCPLLIGWVYLHGVEQITVLVSTGGRKLTACLFYKVKEDVATCSGCANIWISFEEQHKVGILVFVAIDRKSDATHTQGQRCKLLVTVSTYFKPRAMSTQRNTCDTLPLPPRKAGIKAIREML